MGSSEKMVALMLARFLLVESPRILSWIMEMREKGKTEVTEEDLNRLEAKWSIPGARFFE